MTKKPESNSKNPVEVIEYLDYECPNCLEAYPIVKKLEKHFDKKINLVYKNFPISESHPHAVHAALAAESAKLQGKFIQMHDMLFENQENLEDSDLLKYAKKIGLDIEKFKKDFQSKKLTLLVHNDFLEGVRQGVNGTPTFFINKKRHNSDYSYEELEHAIESWL